MRDQAHANHLIHETSPYLLQHAHNPVEWHAWNDEALAGARAQNKPILLSIGYSACHWCHVMAHESFEDADTAALMNRLFVNIKVDREERPDLDRVYQLAHQLLTQRGGGWPLTVFLAPDDLTPFFAGTYFPRESRYGMPAFQEVLTRVADFYHSHRGELRKQNDSLKQVFQHIETEAATPADELSKTSLDAAYRVLTDRFDPHSGGFGPAPKFPHTPALEFLLRHAANPAADADSRAGAHHMLVVTLTRMAEGGIYDQLGGGFCRYATDAEWMIPHFEKMLYDNGPLLALYAQTAKFTGNNFYAGIAGQTAAWVMEEMQSPEGGYYSSLDADSEGQEGKYYVWDMQEIRALLSVEEFAAFAPRYGLDNPPNFEGHWHLHVQKLTAEIAAGREMKNSEIAAQLQSARNKLLAARQRRVPPGLDDKILTAWNGLMIRGLAIAGRLLDEPRCIESARRATKFIHSNLWKQGRLLASWRDAQARLPAYLDDYAFLLDGLLEMLQAHWNSEWFDWARELAEALLADFQDKQRGGFWFTAKDQPVPLYRPKTFGDESLPAGNAVVVRALLILGHLTTELRYLEAAERALKAGGPLAARYPDGHLTLLTALDQALAPPTLVILRGTPEKMAEWQRTLNQRFDPRRIVLAIPDDAGNMTGMLAQCAPRGDICTYVCRGTQCSLPITEVEKLSIPQT